MDTLVDAWTDTRTVVLIPMLGSQECALPCQREQRSVVRSSDGRHTASHGDSHRGLLVGFKAMHCQAGLAGLGTINKGWPGKHRVPVLTAPAPPASDMPVAGTGPSPLLHLAGVSQDWWMILQKKPGDGKCSPVVPPAVTWGCSNQGIQSRPFKRLYLSFYS